MKEIPALPTSYSTKEYSSSENEPSFKNKIQYASLNWITASSAHGLPAIFRTDQIYLKIMWTILFVSSFTSCIYLIAKNTATFFEYNTSVNIGIYTESPSYFPAVTICNLNPFYKTRAEGYINMVLAENNLTFLSNLTKIPQGDTALELVEAAMELIKASICSINSRKYLSFSLDELLISCTYKGFNYFFKFTNL